MAKTKKTRYVILGLLMHGDLSGYDIKKIVEMQLQYFWSESYGQIYPALTELESLQLIVHREEGGAVPRKVYTITELGQKELHRWLKKPVEEEKIRYEVLLKTFLSAADDVETTRQHLLDFKRRQEIHVAALTEYEESLRAVLENNKEHLFYLLTVLCGKRVFQAYCDWCEEALKLLENNDANVVK